MQTQVTVTTDESFVCHMWIDHEVYWDLAAGLVGCENFARSRGLGDRKYYLGSDNCFFMAMKSPSHNDQEM